MSNNNEIRFVHRQETFSDLAVRELAESGTKEVILVAQDTSAYGIDLHDGTDLAGLLESLCAIEGIWKIRILYTYLDRINDKLLDVMAREPKIAKYLDMPLQHCSADILKRMHRYGSYEILRERISAIRDRVPGIVLRSTFMVGFPGETEEQFSELTDFLKDMQFDRAGFFAFSPEEGTPAADYPDQIDEDVKEERLLIAQGEQSRIMEAVQQRAVGREVEAICDGFDPEKLMYVLRSESDTPDVDTVIYALGQERELDPGDIVRVRILSSDGADFYGEF